MLSPQLQKNEVAADAAVHIDMPIVSGLSMIYDVIFIRPPQSLSALPSSTPVDTRSVLVEFGSSYGGNKI